MIILKYEKIFETWEKEINEQNLSNIDNDFYEKCGEILKQAYIEIEKYDSNSLHRKLLENEINNFKYMIKTIYDSRFRKILGRILSLSEIDTTLLDKNEYNLFKKIKDPIQKYIRNVNLLLEGHSIQSFKYDLNQKYLVVQMLENLPEIVGNDKKIYGPFQKEDIISLPRKVAESLFERGAAVIIPVNMSSK